MHAKKDTSERKTPRGNSWQGESSKYNFLLIHSYIVDWLEMKWGMEKVLVRRLWVEYRLTLVVS